MKPQLLSVADVAARGTGWYLPRSGAKWTAVAQRPPTPAAGNLCWWAPQAPPGDGWWARGGTRAAA